MSLSVMEAFKVNAPINQELVFSYALFWGEE